MSSVFERFPWKNGELFNEAADRILRKRYYENWVISRFGGEISKEEDIDIIFNDKYPDATLINYKTGKACRVEFEEKSSDFKRHGHDPKECDIIVCVIHDWKEKFPNENCPLDVYEITGSEKAGKFFKRADNYI